MDDQVVDTPSRAAISRRSYKELAADLLRQRIFSGELRPQERVDQDQIAEQLGISKLPVREALIALEAEGLVVNQPHRGSFVASLSREDVRDHYRIIGFLAGLAARRAAERLTDDQIEQLGAYVEALDREPDPDRQSALNLAFHRTINVAGGSRRVRSVLRLLTNTNPNRFYSFRGGWREAAQEEHRRILAAIQARDPAEAEVAMVDHIVSGGEFGIAQMEERGFWSPDLLQDGGEETRR